MKNIITVLTLVLVAGLSRLIPHPWNFTAVGAMALFSGTRMPHKALAFLAPLLTLVWTDAILGFHETALYVYAAVALITIIGFLIDGKKSSIVAGSLVGSILFFAITNFGVWLVQGMYPRTGAGLLACFTSAIPFFGNQVAGDLFYAGVLFGAYALLKTYAPSLKLAK
jgi:hypothetical protein